MVQIIIDYKWDKYTKHFFLGQFYMFLLFALSFFLDIMIIGINADQMQLTSLIFKAVCILVLLYFTMYEISQAKKEGFINYLSSAWNYIDMMLTISYTAISVL